LEAAERLKAEHGIDCEVVDVRSLVPLDTQTILGSLAKTHRLFTVEEEILGSVDGARKFVSIAVDEGFYEHDGPPVRITTPHISAAGRRYPGRHRAADPGPDHGHRAPLARELSEESRMYENLLATFRPISGLAANGASLPITSVST